VDIVGDNREASQDSVLPNVRRQVRVVGNPPGVITATTVLLATVAVFAIDHSQAAAH